MLLTKILKMKVIKIIGLLNIATNVEKYVERIICFFYSHANPRMHKIKLIGAFHRIWFLESKLVHTDTT